MEVLFRLLRSLLTFHGFSYHPKCIKINLTHLIFTDDLLVFTRGDLPSVQAVDTCLSLFAAYSGLRVNPVKSNLFFGGVPAQLKELILSTTGYVEGDFPNFWGASVLLPKGVVKKINKMCNDFLWGIGEGQRRMVFKSWGSFCCPTQEGGVNIKEVLSWNKCLMLEWIRKIVLDLPTIWVRWIKAYVLKGVSIWEFHLTAAYSWSWSSIISYRDLLLASVGTAAAAHQFLCQADYKKQAYDLFRDKGPLFPMHKTLGDTLNYPKHVIIRLLALQNKLPTIDNL
ncbi:uncharacterized protein LOC141631984 [Silene latifolia]|uniref:uncharacterized protein LOC141631984 n=1 Tax=Silene latifolia TaxID=37657 RepID=UPI003D76BDF8